MLKDFQNNNGFVALISIIIISLLLLTITIVLNFSVFFGRYNVLDSEYKETSVALAEACVDAAILNLANDPDYIPTGTGDTITVDEKKCKIVSIIPTVTWPKTIRTMASPSASFTYLRVVVSGPSPVTVTSWEECPTVCP